MNSDAEEKDLDIDCTIFIGEDYEISEKEDLSEEDDMSEENMSEEEDMKVYIKPAVYLCMSMLSTVFTL